MSELREAAQSISAWAVECDGDLVDVCLTEIAAQLVMENRREANRGRDFAWRVVPLVPLTHSPRDEWRPASEREMLELAAKALGMPEAPKQYRIADGLPIVITYMGKPWNPLAEMGKDMPPRDEWRPASEPPEDLRQRVIAWRTPPHRQSGAWVEALYDDGAWVTRDGVARDITHWRDVTPPTTEGK